MGSPRSRAGPRPRRGRRSPGGGGSSNPKRGARCSTIGTGPALELLKETRKDFGTLKDALIHVAEVTGCSVAAVKRAYHRFRAGFGDAHGRRKLNPSQEKTLVAVVQAFSVNNKAPSVAQMREIIKRKWGVQVFRTWVNRFVGRHRRQLHKRACKALADKRMGKV
eukprot:contig_25501_g6285